MAYTDEPLLDFLMYDARQQAQLEKLPRCGYCDNPIQQEFALFINDEYICDECMDGFMVEVEPER